MTPTEIELRDIVSELYVAVNDLHYHLSAESSSAEDEAPEALRKRAAYLGACGQTLGGVRRRLKELGAVI